MSGVQRRLLRYSQPSHLTFVGEEKENGEFYAKMVRQGRKREREALVFVFPVVICPLSSACYLCVPMRNGMTPGPSGMLPTRHSGASSAQWPTKEVHDSGQESDVHVLPDVQEDADRTESRDSAFQHCSRS